MAEEIINKVAQSGLEQVDFEKWLRGLQWRTFDLKLALWEGLVLKEKDFRAFIDQHSWEEYKDHYVGIYCSEDVIIQPWAYMLLASALNPHAKKVFMADGESIKTEILLHLIQEGSFQEFADKRLIVKGCSKIPDIEKVLTAFVEKVQPIAKTIMFGEPCSTVPIYKQSKK